MLLYWACSGMWLSQNCFLIEWTPRVKSPPFLCSRGEFLPNSDCSLLSCCSNECLFCPHCGTCFTFALSMPHADLVHFPHQQISENASFWWNHGKILRFLCPISFGSWQTLQGWRSIALICMWFMRYTPVGLSGFSRLSHNRGFSVFWPDFSWCCCSEYVRNVDHWLPCPVCWLLWVFTHIKEGGFVHHTVLCTLHLRLEY